MNHAHIGNIVFERGDGEPVPDFRQRARDAVAELGGGVLAWGAPEGLEWIAAEPEVITVEGGLDRNSFESFAQFGDTLVERLDGESVEDFHRRARKAAVAAGAAHVVFGGLRLVKFDDDDKQQSKGETE